MGQIRLRRGFTLVELLVVVALIGILSTLGLASFRTSRLKARDAQRKSDLSQTRAALEIYYSDLGNYPPASNYQIQGGGASCGTAVVGWGSDWSCGNPSVNYMAPLPVDPLEGQDYRYVRLSSDVYYLEACLEDANDRQGVNVGSSQTGFTGGNCASSLIFQVTSP